jgi:hypothetical protein
MPDALVPVDGLHARHRHFRRAGERTVIGRRFSFDIRRTAPTSAGRPILPSLE